MRPVSTSASAVRNATSGWGWNIAAVFNTTGEQTKRPSAATRSHGLPGNTIPQRIAVRTPVATVRMPFSSWPKRSGSVTPSRSPSSTAAPATRKKPGGV